jgi:hypothetical protein
MRTWTPLTPSEVEQQNANNKALTGFPKSAQARFTGAFQVVFHPCFGADCTEKLSENHGKRSYRCQCV